LYMTEPNAEPAALNTVISQTRPLASDLTQNPNLAAAQELIELRYDGDPRYFAIPSVDDLDTFGLERGREIFAEHFGDASDFVFVFAGDFDPDEIERLSARYLGTLPADGVEDEFADTAPAPPTTPTRGEVQAGTEQGSVTYLWNAPANYDETTRMTMRYLEIIVAQRLRVLLREQLSATYSPFVSMTLNELPRPTIDTYLQIGSDPERLPEVIDALRANLDDLRATGPTGSEFATAREQLTSEFQLVDNGLYMDALLYYTTHPNEDPNELGARPLLVGRISAADVQALAAAILPANAYVEVTLTPR
ncbi:MAG: insulinase family protein, partial [Acidimicrobiales bacterium]|nr:insulinase family protein [Acidimicrobiales bacterium]